MSNKNATETKIILTRPENASCCNSCPFLKENHGKHGPNCVDEAGEQMEKNWYDSENVHSKFEQTFSTGLPFICHSSDPNAVKYGGAEGIKSGKERFCVGMTVLIWQHLSIVQEELEKLPVSKASFHRGYIAYKKRVAKNERRTEDELKDWIMNFHVGYAGGLIPSKAAMLPRTVSEKREVSLP